GSWCEEIRSRGCKLQLQPTRDRPRCQSQLRRSVQAARNWNAAILPTELSFVFPPAPIRPPPRTPTSPASQDGVGTVAIPPPPNVASSAPFPLNLTTAAWYPSPDWRSPPTIDPWATRAIPAVPNPLASKCVVTSPIGPNEPSALPFAFNRTSP